MQAKIVVLPGDGIGPEVTAEAVNVLKQTAECFGHSFHFEEYSIGHAAEKALGDKLPSGTLKAASQADAVLVGALDMGLSRDEPMFHAEAARGLVEIKRALGMVVSLRSVKPYAALHSLSPLRPEVLEKVDLLLVRSLCNSMPGECDQAVMTLVTDAACRFARGRRRHVTSVDLAMRADAPSFRKAAAQIAATYSDVQLESLPVDVCLQQMLFDPRNLDVILADNMIGAVLANQAVALVGSAALLPAGARGMGHLGVYAPACGPLLDQAGVQSVNPIGAILAAAMLLRHSFNMESEAQAIEKAADSALGAGMRTADIAASGERVISTHAMGEAVAAWICSFAGQSQRSLRAEE